MKNKRQVIVAPSILSANFYNLEKDLNILRENRVKWLHFDVMDGHFVNNISFGVPVFKSLKPHLDFVNDVHIMVSEPYKWGEVFAKIGASYVTFHYEALNSDEEILKTINVIHENGSKVGISIKPATSIDVIIPFLDKIDLVLIMSVEPGFGGQGFLHDNLEKVRVLRDIIDNRKYNVLIEIDGGINETTAKLARDAGVDVLVAGSYLFGHDDFAKRLKSLRE